MREKVQPAASCKKILADLHIHTGLSPCAVAEMTPPSIVEAAVKRGLSMVAICDHNSSANAAAVQAAAGDRLTVLAGIEITTSEEIHVIGLFPNVVDAQAVSDQVRSTLPNANRAYFRRFGPQAVMDSAGRIIDHEMAKLAAASTFNLHDAVKLITAHSGLAVACHIDRPSFSVISQLGVFPRDVGFDAVELSASHVGLQPPQRSNNRRRHHYARPSFFSDAGCEVGNSREQDYAALGLPIITSSDSHFLAGIGCGCCVLEAFGRTFSELALALARVGSRSATAKFGNLRGSEVVVAPQAPEQHCPVRGGCKQRGGARPLTRSPKPEARNPLPESRGIRRA